MTDERQRRETVELTPRRDQAARRKQRVDEILACLRQHAVLGGTLPIRAPARSGRINWGAIALSAGRTETGPLPVPHPTKRKD